jgi:WD40 repeat protein
MEMLEVRLWDATNGATVGNLNLLGVGAFALSDDGKRLAGAAADGTVRLLDTTSGTVVGEPLEHVNVRNVTFSGNGMLLATVSRDGVRLWNARGGAAVGEVLNHSDVKAIAFSDDGKRLATASDDRTVRLWKRRALPRLASR